MRNLYMDDSDFNALLDRLPGGFMEAAMNTCADLRSVLAEMLAEAGVLPMSCRPDQFGAVAETLARLDQDRRDHAEVTGRILDALTKPTVRLEFTDDELKKND